MKFLEWLVPAIILAVLVGILGSAFRYGRDLLRLRDLGCEYTGRAHSTISGRHGSFRTSEQYEYKCSDGRKLWSRVSPADLESGGP